MYVLWLLLITGVLSTVRCSSDNESNSTILTLNETNINDAINKNKNIFINFYASWCKHSKRAAPEYLKAAERAMELGIPITFAKIESTGKRELFDIPGFPTFKLFRKGVPVVYRGEYDSESFIEWLQDHIKPINTLNSIAETIKLINSESLVVIGFFKNITIKAQTFEKIAESFDKPAFAVTSSDEIFNEYNATSDSVMLLKKFDKEVLFTGDLTLENLKKFLESQPEPLLQELNRDTLEEVYSKFSDVQKNVFILVSANDKSKTTPILEAAKVAAKEYLNKIKFTIIDVDLEYLAPILTHFHVVSEEIPGMIMTPNAFESGSYKLSGNLSLKNIKTFLQYFLKGSMDELVSEKLPDDWNKRPVYTLVKTNFLNVTHDLDKNVLVYYYIGNCDECLKWNDIIEAVGKAFADKEDVIVSKINVALNAIDDKLYLKIPSIALFRKTDNKYVIYEGKPNVDNIIKFVKLEGENQNKKNLVK